jgi:L-alanine-DL-glutamate epimerase-like enolase superfamily enzyme
MKITKVSLYKTAIKKKFLTKNALGSSPTVKNVLVKVDTDEGIYGWGEIAYFTPVTGSTQDSEFELAKSFGKYLLGKDPTNIEDLTKNIHNVFHQPTIEAAFNSAFFDILGKIANLPIYKILGGSNRKIRTDITIGIMDTVEETVQRAEEIKKQNFSEIKLKAGRKDYTDVKYVAALRNLFGDDVAIRIDANQGWNVPMAIKNIDVMEPYDLEYVEQPLPVWDLEGFVHLRNSVNVPICADESVFSEHDAFKIITMGAADYLNIKLGKCGGITSGLKINSVAESAGIQCMLGCFGETRVGLTIAAHLAIARPNISFLDLDCAYAHAEDPVIGGMEYDKKIGGLIHVPQSSGLGLDLKNEFLDNCEKYVIKN